MTEKATIGQKGEEATTQYLIKNGYTILERNWHCRYGEIDIIATKEDTIAFVEVKTRKLGSMTTPQESVNGSKQKKITLSAQKYLLETGNQLQPRFDVAAVTYDPNGFHCDYLPNAFEAFQCEW